MKIKRNRLFLFGALLLGAFLRFYELASKSFWYDEAMHVGRISFFSSFSELFSIGDSNPPLYFYLMKVWTTFFGVSVVSLRSFSALLGVASILVVYKVGKKISNRKLGLVSAFILAISPLHIFYSQEAGVYSLLMFLFLVFLYVVIRLGEKNKLRLYFYLAAVLALLLLTHYTSMLLIFSVFVYMLLQLRNNNYYRIPVWITIIITFVYYLSVLIMLVNIRPEVVGGLLNNISWINRVSLLNMVFSLFESFSYGGLRFGGADVLLPNSALIFGKCIFAIFIFLFLKGLLSKDLMIRNRFKLLILLVVFGPLVLSWFFSLLFFPIFVVRYYISSLGGFVILVAKGFVDIRNKLVKCFISFLILLLVMFSLFWYYDSELKLPWNDVISYLEDKNIEDDSLVVFNPFFQSYVLMNNFFISRNILLGEVIPVDLFDDMCKYEKPFLFKYSRGKHYDFEPLIISLEKGDKVFLIQTRWSECSQRIGFWHPLYLWDFPNNPVKVRDRFIANLDMEEEMIFNSRGDKIDSWDDFDKTFHNERGIYLGLFYLR